jgi:hypothetical protein
VTLTDPSPVVRLSGVDLAGTATGAGPLVLEGLSVQWGRTELLAQPSPATANVSLFVADGTWAVSTDLIGQVISLRWEATRPGDTTVSSGVFFYGRVTGATITRRPDIGDGTAGTVVALTCSSILTDLANRVPPDAWPTDTFTGRRNALLPYLGGAITGPAEFRSSWLTGPNVAAVPVDQQKSALQTLTDLYSWCGSDRFTYLPATRRATFIVRRAVSQTAQLARDTAGTGTAREGKGAYLRTIAVAATEGMPFDPHYLDGQMLSYDGGLSRDITGRITRVEVTHQDSSAAFAQRTDTAMVSAVAGAATTDEAVLGVRALRQSSGVVWNNFAQIAASDLATMVAREGAGWRTGELVLDTTVPGAGFEYFDQFAALALAGGEVQSAVFLQRTWLPALGIRPVVGIIGGRIEHTGGGWRIGLNVAPISTGTVPQHPISWSEIDDGGVGNTLIWTDDDDPFGLHESLTYEDIYYCNRGLGMITPPANSGWDYTLS